MSIVICLPTVCFYVACRERVYKSIRSARCPSTSQLYVYVCCVSWVRDGRSTDCNIKNQICDGLTSYSLLYNGCHRTEYLSYKFVTTINKDDADRPRWREQQCSGQEKSSHYTSPSVQYGGTKSVICITSFRLRSKLGTIPWGLLLSSSRRWIVNCAVSSSVQSWAHWIRTNKGI